MPKYNIHLITTASTVIDFETDETDPDRIEAAFWDQPGGVDTPTLCHQCAGSSNRQNLDVGDDWEIVRNEDGTREIWTITDKDEDDD